ncbi:MAG: DNA repair protein RecO [Patescibacteria group bacterium]
MSHHVYTTKGIVLALYPTKEADKTASILTRDLGLVRATARGIRKSSSKLTTPLTEFAISKVSLVKGKNFWRVTTVTLLHNSFVELRGKREALKSLARVTSLLSSLVKGEEKNVELYDELEANLLSLIYGDVRTEEAEDWEIFTVARLLSHLGYLSKEDAPATLKDVKKNKKKIVSSVNSGISLSGLR